jgi:DNA-binding transcriptional LysR family regulator
MEIRQLRAFVALVDHGSTRRAADVLGLAQSTVSEALLTLERALGTRIGVRQRGAGRRQLTAAGRALLPHARAILAAVDAAHAAVATATVEARGRLEIIANESVSTYLLPTAVARLRARWQRLHIGITVGTCADVRAGVREGRFGVGILLERPEGTSPEYSLRGELLSTEVPLVMFVGRAHPLARAANGRPTHAVSRESLSGYPVFISDAAGDFHGLVEAYLTSDGLPAPMLVAAGTVEGVKRGVMVDSRALGVLPAYALDAELAAGSALPVPLSPAPPTLTLKAITAPGSDRHPALDALLASLRGGGPVWPPC